MYHPYYLLPLGYCFLPLSNVMNRPEDLSATLESVDVTFIAV